MSWVTTLREGVRVAKKPWCCQMCSAAIPVGHRHNVQTNVYDGRAYDWRECLPCTSDGVIHFVHVWTGGYYDEGVNYESAEEWASESIGWSKSGKERAAARAWLARAAGGEGE